MFILEKSLSLQLGRSSTLRDHDISMPLKFVQTGYQVGGSLGVVSPKWLRLSQIDGRVYDEIYSPEALHQPPDLRNSRARRLVADMEEIINDSNSLQTAFLRERRQIVGDRVDDVLMLCEKISHLSLMSLIYRGVYVKNTPFCGECIDSARQALTAHAKGMSLMENRDTQLFDMCIIWTLVFSTFVPFFVIVCQAIWTVNAAELDVIELLINLLETGQDQSESTSRLLKTFKPLYGAASKYIELESKASSCATGSAISFEIIYQETASAAELPPQWSNCRL